MGWIQLIEELSQEPVEVNTKVDKEELIQIIRNLVELMNLPRQPIYFPITPEMNSVMLRMIDQLPDGGFIIKTERNEL